MLSQKEVLSIFREKGALKEGHFELSSGLHSGEYVQAALVLQYPSYADKLCRSLSCYFEEENVQLVISPAIGGIIVGQKVAEVLGARAIFAERVQGKLVLRRGFDISYGERTLIVEDVITTGGSVREVIEIVEAKGGIVVGVGCLVDRSEGKVVFSLGKDKKKVIRPKSLLSLRLQTYSKQDCPLCRKGLPLSRPGSRKDEKKSYL